MARHSLILASAALAHAAVAAPLDLTSLVNAGVDVRGPSAVVLPGINAKSFAGSFQVNETDGASLFCWYWPALDGNASAPLLVWLQGGPGSSSLFGAFAEMGPYRINGSGVPVANPNTWASHYAMVFVDNPRGTGFSTTSPGTLCTEWRCYANDFDSFLRQFVSAFSITSPVYITGESYGGHYVPASAFVVHTNNAAGVLPHVNLAGVAIGNGFVAPPEMSSGYADIIFNAGLIDDRELLVAQSYVANISSYIAEEDYVQAYLTWDAFLNGDSTPGGAWFTNVTGLTNYYNVATEMGPDLNYWVAYVTSPLVRDAIHVGDTPFADGNIAVELALRGDVMYTQKPRLEALLSAGYAVLIYNGALDLICGAPLTERYVPLLSWPGTAAWGAAPKTLWHDPAYGGAAISGYVRRYANLVQAVVRGGGHLLPYDAPERALDLITRFIDGVAFD